MRWKRHELVNGIVAFAILLGLATVVILGTAFNGARLN